MPTRLLLSISQWQHAAFAGVDSQGRGANSNPLSPTGSASAVLRKHIEAQNAAHPVATGNPAATGNTAHPPNHIVIPPPWPHPPPQQQQRYRHILPSIPGAKLPIPNVPPAIVKNEIPIRPGPPPPVVNSSAVIAGQPTLIPGQPQVVAVHSAAPALVSAPVSMPPAADKPAADKPAAVKPASGSEEPIILSDSEDEMPDVAPAKSQATPVASQPASAPSHPAPTTTASQQSGASAAAAGLSASSSRVSMNMSDTDNGVDLWKVRSSYRLKCELNQDAFNFR